MKSFRFLGLLLVVGLLFPGCSRPAAVDRDNRRVLEEILTAITLSNARLLEDSAKRAKERYDAGHLTDEEYRAMEAIINKARAGDWGAAESDAYLFRKKHPFVQR
jgi:hypothetical protein